MASKSYDPLAFIPSAAVIRSELEKTERLAHRLRILLDLAEKLNLPLVTGDEVEGPSTGYRPTERRTAVAHA